MTSGKHQTEVQSGAGSCLASIDAITLLVHISAILGLECCSRSLTETQSPSDWELFMSLCCRICLIYVGSFLFVFGTKVHSRSIFA